MIQEFVDQPKRYTHRAPVPPPKTLRIPPNTNTKKDTKDTYEYENNTCVHMLLLRSSPKPFPFLETVSVSFFHPVLVARRLTPLVGYVIVLVGVPLLLVVLESVSGEPRG